jgi:hypothetical protein
MIEHDPLNACQLEVFLHTLKIIFNIFYVVASKVLGQTEENSNVITSQQVGWSWLKGCHLMVAAAVQVASEIVLQLVTHSRFQICFRLLAGIAAESQSFEGRSV